MRRRKSIWILYDDRDIPSENILNVVGESSFGNIVHKRIKLQDKFKNLINEITEFDVERFIIIDSQIKMERTIAQLAEEKNEFSLIYIKSKAIILDKEKFVLAIQKSFYSDKLLTNDHNNPLVKYYSNKALFIEDVTEGKQKNSEWFDSQHVLLPNDFLFDISIYRNFLGFFSGGFETRYFNSLSGDKYTITKSSADLQKMQKEHDLYELLPSEMRSWFVTPYNLVIKDGRASYTMERLNIPDVAVQWIHGSMLEKDFEVFLEKIFYFIQRRPRKKISNDDYQKHFNDLFINKVRSRIRDLKNMNEYKQIELLLETGTRNKNIDHLLSKYEGLVSEYKNNNKFELEEVIGHGDLCFSNMLYDKNTNLLKLIDPKGAISKDELWTNPYYDIAKLSHSINGNYDFINNEMFAMLLNSDCNFEISFDNLNNLNRHKELFKQELVINNFDPYLVRLCEASLFLSMLPLHMDHPRKVLGFIINAANILEELENGRK